MRKGYIKPTKEELDELEKLMDKIVKDKSKVVEDYHIETLIEEFAIQIYSNMSLNDYILTHESKVINGRPEWYSVNVNGAIIDSPRRINNYVTSMIEKDLYLIHT
jgi:hypothetical protein